MEDDSLVPETPEPAPRPSLTRTAVGIGAFFVLAALPFALRPSVPPLTSAVVLNPKTTDPALLEQTLEVLRRRLDNARIPGRVELVDAQIQVSLNELDVERAKPYLLERQVLQFLLVHETTEVEAVLVRMHTEPDPARREFLAGKDPRSGELVLLERQGGLSNEQFEDFDLTQDSSERPCIGFKMTLAGGKALYELTSRSIGRKLAVVLDDRVLSVPTIRSAIRNRGVIESGTGDWDEQELRTLLTSLRSGALPVDVTFAHQKITPHR